MEWISVQHPFFWNSTFACTVFFTTAELYYSSKAIKTSSSSEKGHIGIISSLGWQTEVRPNRFASTSQSQLLVCPYQKNLTLLLLTMTEYQLENGGISVK